MQHSLHEFGRDAASVCADSAAFGTCMILGAMNSMVTRCLLFAPESVILPMVDMHS
jgi:hypothetical protein